MFNTLKSPVRMFCVMPPLVLLLASANVHARQHLAISLKGASETPPVATTAKGREKNRVSKPHGERQYPLFRDCCDDGLYSRSR